MSKKLIDVLSRLIGKGRVFKFLFNISPMYRGTGAKIVHVNTDLQFVRIKLRLNFRTRNYVGTIYGGHLYSSVDGVYMVQLIQILGKEYVVWDKAATIKFKRPANKHVFADFSLPDELLSHIKAEVAQKKERDFQFSVTLKDKEGTVYSEVEKTIYIAEKSFYRAKKAKRTS